MVSESANVIFNEAVFPWRKASLDRYLANQSLPSDYFAEFTLLDEHMQEAEAQAPTVDTAPAASVPPSEMAVSLPAHPTTSSSSMPDHTDHGAPGPPMPPLETMAAATSDKHADLTPARTASAPSPLPRPVRPAVIPTKINR